MNPEQWSRVKDIFNAALEQEPGRRRTFVVEASAGDHSVLAEVERLLDAQRESADFIEHPAAATLLSGRIISHYEIGRLIGSGGMGHVYAARDTELGREVALKVAALDGDDAQARLRREAQHASRLSHPHICHIYDVGRADGQLFVVMELVNGKSLSDLVRDGQLSIANATRYGMEIADALAHAHEHGVTHRDLKSTNVIITPKLGAKVLDFGLARRLDTHQIDALSHSQRSLTGEGTIAGTLPYMAPELLRGERGDQRSDIWALGVLLYEMVAGRRPFTGATGFEVSAGILHQEMPALPPTVPAPMRAIIQRCLEKDPARRYQNAADVFASHEYRFENRFLSVHLGLEKVKGRRRPLRNRLLFVAGLLVAAVAWYVTQSPTVGNLMSNVQGYSLLEEGKFDEAIEQFQGVTRQSPDEADPWDSLGEGYLANGMPDKSLEAYLRALSVEPVYQASILGRGLALAALGRYDEALERESPDFRVQAFLLSRVGRYREAAGVLDNGRRGDDDAEINANALLTSAWLQIEQKQYARALDDVRAARKALAERQDHSFLVLADLIGGIAELRAGDVQSAASRLAAQKSRDASDPIESNWVAALEGEIALAQGQYHRAASSFKAAQTKAWQTLGRDASTVFAANLPSRDGLARIEMARGNRAAAIEEYKRLTAEGPVRRTSAVLEPRDILELARLLDAQGDPAGARVEYERFLKLWANADAGLPEMSEAKTAIAAERK